MIRVTKGAIPPSLAKNKAVWTAELKALLAAGEAIAPAVWNRYNQPDVKKQAVTDSHSKCVYCESKVTHVSFGDLEHIKPKKRFPDTAYEWQNLVLVCTRCNNAKSDRYNEESPPVNPLTENPDVFLVAYGNQVWSRPGQDRGAETIALADLNRADLLEQRLKRCKQIQQLSETIVRTTAPLAKAALLDQLHMELSDAGEYGLVARGIAKTMGVIA